MRVSAPKAIALVLHREGLGAIHVKAPVIQLLDFFEHLVGNIMRHVESGTLQPPDIP